MKVKLFAVYDSKAESYMIPFPMQTTELAIRSFTEGCLDPNSNFNKYPLDFYLYELGVYDDEKGTVENLKTPKQLITAQVALRNLKAVQNQVQQLQEIPDNEISNDSES